MNVFKVTIQAFIMDDTDPRKWSQDDLMSYLIDHQKAVALSECVKLVPECVAVPAIKHQRKERKETDCKAKNKKTKGRPSEESSNGSLVVHHANGRHEFYDASTNKYFVNSRVYRFREGTGEIEFEYKSHQYIGIAQRKYIGTFESVKRKNRSPGLKVYLTKLESDIVAKESYERKNIAIKLREEIVNGLDSSEPDVNNGVVRFDNYGNVKSLEHAEKQ